MVTERHLSEQQLLHYIDGELSGRAATAARRHLERCWSCRTRRVDLEGVIHNVVRLHQDQFLQTTPPIDAPRALLRARISQLARPSHRFWPLMAAISAPVLVLVFLLARVPAARRQPFPSVVSTPDSHLTPGATLVADRRIVCSEPNTKNKAVSPLVQKQVFAEYGITGADPAAYELDYLVTPALGGADDIHNLWPHSYAETAWNARVKDTLEDHLRDMVCAGSLDLNTAQRDIATNWIAAYKKYFRTQTPLRVQ